MIGRDSKQDVEAYGLWPWIAGLVLAAVIIALMFGYSAGIS